MAPTAHKNASEQRSDRTATPRDRERSEQSPIPTTVRCRPDADGVTVWVPSEPIDDTPGPDAEA